MVAIWKAIREGANAYLKRQFRTIAIIAIIIAVVIIAAFGATVNLTYGGEIAFSFLLGVAFSLFAAYIAMYSATNSNVRSTAAAEKSTYEALKVATLGGGALGLIVSIILFQGISGNNVYYVTMPLIVRSLGIVATFVGLAVAVYEKKFKNPIKPTRDGLLVASLIAAILLFIATWYVFGPSGLTTLAGVTSANRALGAYALYGCMIAGLVSGLLIVLYTEFYTGSEARWVVTIA